LHLRYLRYKDLKKKLEKLGECTPLRQKGSHEIWKCPGGKKFPVPRHPGDLKKGTLAKIVKQAGLGMSVSEFMGAKV
jgi:predicted RNA binding protein YcfA (HicA-like mRNA interferase family)